MGVVAFLKSKHESLNRLVPISPPVEAFFIYGLVYDIPRILGHDHTATTGEP